MECGICGTTALRTCRKAYHQRLDWIGVYNEECKETTLTHMDLDIMEYSSFV